MGCGEIVKKMTLVKRGAGQGMDTKKISDRTLEDLKVLLVPQNLHLEKCDKPPATSRPLEKPLDSKNTFRA